MDREDFSDSQCAAKRLLLVQFYLPRLLATGSAPLPEHWWQAMALQQLGQAVLDTYLHEYHLAGQGPVPRLVLACRRSLERLKQRWRTYRYRSIWQVQPAADWLYMQDNLRQAMPVIIQLLQQTIEGGEDVASAYLEEQKGD